MFKVTFFIELCALLFRIGILTLIFDLIVRWQLELIYDEKKTWKIYCVQYVTFKEYIMLSK